MPPSPDGMQTPARRAQRFGRDRRIRRRSDFQRVFDSGRRIQGRYLTVIALSNGSSTTRVGIVASRRLGDAVGRNRAKRRIRELFRRTLFEQPGLDLVVIPRRELLHAPYAILESDFRAIVRRTGRAPRQAGG